jgi:hypothetical protein
VDGQNEDAKVGQIINWYLVQAEKGGHRESGVRESEANLKTQWNMCIQHITPEFRARRFKDLAATDMQVVIDSAAASGSEKAASWLKTIFDNVDKFAVQQGVLSSTRTKRLLSPDVGKEPAALSEAAFKSIWEALSFCGNGGATVDRGPCLAVLLSGVTLQPFGNVVTMRRSEVDFGRKLWLSADPARYVYLSDLALEVVSKAVELGDLTHRDPKTDFVFPSGGPKRDPARPVSYSLTFDVMKRVTNKAATPHALRLTGIASLQALGGEELRSLVKSISKGNFADPPNAMHAGLLDGWAERVRQITKKPWNYMSVN